MLSAELCRARQHRLRDLLAQLQLDAVVLTSPHHVYRWSGHRPGWQHHAALLLFADGGSTLISANHPDQAAAVDEAISYEANWMGTLRQEQPAAVAVMAEVELEKRIGMRRRKTIGIDSGSANAELVLRWDSGPPVSIDSPLFQHRRVKDADELSLMQRAVRCTEAMYSRAREIVRPGVAELDVFAELNHAAVRSAGEPLTALMGNDFACGVGGGPARDNHQAAAGQLYVLDLGPCYRGFFADNCRTISVDRRPTDVQIKAWEAIVGSLRIVEQMAKPGVSCRSVFAAVDEHLKNAGYAGMPHHLGHGVGLQPHEYPHLNPKWDDLLLEGEVFTAEPGLYGSGINGGIRIENPYLVTADGVKNMLDHPETMV